MRSACHAHGVLLRSGVLQITVPFVGGVAPKFGRRVGDGVLDPRDRTLLLIPLNFEVAIALGVAACEQGRSVRFVTLAQLANELQEAESKRELQRVVSRYRRFDLIILDELGYLALPEGAAELVFQVISERNEKVSLIVTTNLPFGEWTKVFPDARLEGRRRSAHPPCSHHRHRRDVVALQARHETQGNG